MVDSIYITSAEGYSGKSTIALGVLDTLLRSVERVGVFRPVARSSHHPDYVLELLLAHLSAGRASGAGIAPSTPLNYDECVGVSYDEVHLDPDAALGRIVQRYKAVEAKCDAVVVIGSDYTDVGSPTELAFNLRIAANLGVPVLLVLGGRVSSGQGETFDQGDKLGQSDPRTPDDIRQLTDVTLAELRTEHVSLVGVIVNRADPARLDDLIGAVRDVIDAPGSELVSVPVWAVPEDPYIVARA